MTTLFDTALAELGTVLNRVDEDRLDTACRMLADAGKFGVYAGGREGLQVKGFAMRAFHLGMPVGVIGDMTMPPLGEGDIYLAVSGPGETQTVLTLMRVAKEAGATVMLITAEENSSAAKLADFVLLMPAQTMASDQGNKVSSVLPMGSVFEGALFVLFEIMVLKLREQLYATPELMRARHTNME